MNSAETKKIAIKWIESFQKHDLEMLLSLYHESARHYSPKLKLRQPETNGLLVGKDALRNWWQDAFDRYPTLNYEIIRLIAEDQSVFMDYIRHAAGEEDIRVGEVLEVENNLIIASRVYHG